MNQTPEETPEGTPEGFMWQEEDNPDVKAALEWAEYTSRMRHPPTCLRAAAIHAKTLLKAYRAMDVQLFAYELGRKKR